MPVTTPDAPDWLPLADVCEQVGVAVDVDSDRVDAVERARLAAAAWVQRQRPDLMTPNGYAPTADVVAGALLLAARIHARKGSPQGLASYGDFGPAPVTRLDPDIERLLGIGRYGRPAVG